MKPSEIVEAGLPDALQILLHRLRRGGRLFLSLYLIFLGCACAALCIGIFRHGWLPWAFLAFFMSVVCRLTVLLHLRQRYASAWKVAKTPEVVYWGHSIDQQGLFTNTAVTASHRIKFHLKDGAHLAIEAVRGAGISQDQLREVISWLDRRNSSIRWGSYDQPVS